jgi:aspartate/tyrosine/aromatic aminotransferase
MKYTLACSKEMLGEIRSKYSTIPIPDSEVVMNGPELKSEAQQEKADLITQLREDLERTATQMQLQIQKENSENVQGVLKTIPMKIYIG